MVEIVIAIVSAVVIGHAVWYGKTWLRRHGHVQTEPSVLLLEHKRAPKDLWHFIRPGTSVAKMREHLGAPYFSRTSNLPNPGSQNKPSSRWTYGYKFSNLNLEVTSRDGESIASIVMVLPSVKQRYGFEVPMLHLRDAFVFGKSRLGK